MKQPGMVYRFKIAPNYNKRVWRRIDILKNQKVGELDMMIRNAFEYEADSHLSQFFRGKAWNSEGFGVIEPGEKGYAENKLISGLGFLQGDVFEYVYDFGDDIDHTIKLEKIFPAEEKTDYPLLSGRNKPKYVLCESCLKDGRETVATWICNQCSYKEERDVVICEECLLKYHNNHFAEKILY
ncbi:MAG: hypothetical protein PHP13_05385 [Methanomicrobium sp.]|nr:hypothetical protein [Methanomicrobium sp.]MDD4300341.1 hypothetical protein [Methanomicrobium sp.]